MLSSSSAFCPRWLLQWPVNEGRRQQSWMRHSHGWLWRSPRGARGALLFQQWANADSGSSLHSRVLTTPFRTLWNSLGHNASCQFVKAMAASTLNPVKPNGAFGLRPKTTIVPTSLVLFKDAGRHSLATKKQPTVLNSARVRNRLSHNVTAVQLTSAKQPIEMQQEMRWWSHW